MGDRSNAYLLMPPQHPITHVRSKESLDQPTSMYPLKKTGPGKVQRVAGRQRQPRGICVRVDGVVRGMANGKHAAKLLRSWRSHQRTQRMVIRPPCTPVTQEVHHPTRRHAFFSNSVCLDLVKNSLQKPPKHTKIDGRPRHV